MSYKTYNKYKKSNIEWIGNIPTPWKINKIKNMAYVKGRIGWHGLTSEEYADNGAYLVTGTDFVKGDIAWSNCNHISYDRYNQDPNIHLKTGDLLITKDGTIGKLALIKDIPDKATLNSGIFLVRPTTKHYINEYLYWVLFSDIFIRFFDYIKKGSTISHLYQETFEGFIFPYPNIKEQKQIANYLDKKTAKIDTIIAKNEELIQLLEEKRVALINQVVTKGLNPDVPMKDSGVEWIGEIPENSNIVLFRRICTLNQGLQYPQEKRLPSPSENSMLYITVKYLNSKEKVEEYIPNPINRVICTEDDVLVARTGATGEVFTNLSGVFHNNFFRVNYNENIYKNYLVYYLQMDSIKKILLLKAGVTTIPDLNHDSFLDTPFILHKFDEQKHISEYLDIETSKIDKAISKIQKNIALLEEYKTSLIHHVVTGKIDVRGEEI